MDADAQAYAPVRKVKPMTFHPRHQKNTNAEINRVLSVRRSEERLCLPFQVDGSPEKNVNRPTVVFEDLDAVAHRLHLDVSVSGRHILSFMPEDRGARRSRNATAVLTRNPSVAPIERLNRLRR
jgi:hypothetical protein